MSVTDEIKARLDVVTVLSQYIQLRKAGRNYTGLCPFHSEKTPSFVVFPESQNWRCFGACGEGGDIFNFVMKHDGLDFSSALKMLADKAGVQLEERTPDQANRDEHVEKLRGLVNETATFFHEKLLNSPDAEAARAYARKRGLTEKTITEFGIGFAPDDWRQALDHLTGLGYEEKDIVEAGVAIHNDEKGRVYDRFRNRLIIPIFDGRGHAIGFGARALNPDDNPKYLNSPQSPLFDKSATLFGLHMARRTIRESETAVIVEGYMDTIQAHQAGFTNVVAQMGTALTESQLKQLSRYAKRLILALDSDAAGVQATMRGLNVALKTLGNSELMFDAKGILRQAGKLGIEIMVITVPGAKDPDDLIRENPQAWAQLVEAATPVVDYVIEIGTSHLNERSTFGDREGVARELLPILMATENDLQTNYNIQRLALKLRLDERTLIQWAQQHRKAPRIGVVDKPKPQQSQQSQQAQSQAPGTSGTPAEGSPATPAKAPEAVQRTHVMERYCLSILMRDPRLWSQANRKLREVAALKSNVMSILGPLSAEDFVNSDSRAIIQLLEQALAQDDLEPIEYLEQHLPHELRVEVERLLSDPIAAIRMEGIRGITEREWQFLREATIREPEEFLKQILDLRKQRLIRENQELYFLQQEADPETSNLYTRKVSANRNAISLIDSIFIPKRPTTALNKKGRDGPLPQKTYGKTS